MTIRKKDTGPSKGNFIAFLNGDKQSGDDRPTFSGRLTLPGEERERSLALWSRKDKAGRVMLTGQTDHIAGSALEQIVGLADAPAAEAPDVTIGQGKEPLKLSAREIVLFQNKAAGEQGPKAAKRPDFYGWHHTGEPGRGAMRISVWAKTDVKGRAYLTGNVRPLEQTHEQVQAESHVQDREPEPVA